METNEQRQKAISAAIQEALEEFFAPVQDWSKADLEHREEPVVKTSQQMEKSLLVQERVWDVAHTVSGSGTVAATAGATHACSLLEEGPGEALVAAIAALPPIPPEPGPACSCPERAVRQACTRVVAALISTRAKRSGMRWTPEGLDVLLPVRTAVLNGACDSLWEQEYAAWLPATHSYSRRCWVN